MFAIIKSSDLVELESALSKSRCRDNVRSSHILAYGSTCSDLTMSGDLLRLEQRSRERRRLDS